MNIIYETRGDKVLKGMQRVFLFCRPENAGLRDLIISDILSYDAGMDCAVGYRDGDALDEQLLRDEFFGIQVLVLVVTPEFLIAGKMPVEYDIAFRQNVPILPVVSDMELFPRFTEMAGAVHGISYADNEYRVKLREQLETFLAPEAEMKAIRENAFSAISFLSYRKKDLAEARSFMKAFHDIDEFLSVAVWYDNFLTAGRNFNYEIEDSIKNCDVFVLLATPNLATSGNYVQTTEYPYAKQIQKPVISVEALPTNHSDFRQLFPGAEILCPAGDADSVRKVFSEKLGQGLRKPDSPDHEYILGLAYLKGIMLERDGARAVKIFESAAEKGYIRAARQLSNMYYSGAGVHIDYGKALLWSQKETALCEKKYGASHPDTLTSKVNTAMLLSESGHFQDALGLYEEVLPVYEKIMELETDKTASFYNNIAHLHEKIGGYKAAIEYFEKSLAIRKVLHGDEHSLIAASYNNIASVYRSQEKFDDALTWFNKALVIQEAVLGCEHPETANTYNNIGTIYFRLGRITEMQEVLTKAVAIFEKSFGASHPWTATAYANIGEGCRIQGNYDKAMELGMKAKGIREKIFGEEHLLTADIYNNIASVLNAKGEPGEAIEWLKKSIGIKEKIYIGDHESLALGYNNLGGILLGQGRLPEAIEWYQKALVIYEKTLGTDTLSTAMIYCNMGIAYSNLKNNDKGRDYMQKAFAIREKLLGKDHPDTKRICGFIAATYVNEGNQAKANEWYSKTYGNDAEIEPGNNDKLIYYFTEAEKLFGKNSLAEAMEIYKKLVPSAILLCETQSPQAAEVLATIYFRIGMCYSRSQKSKDSLEWYQKALDACPLNSKIRKQLEERANAAKLLAGMGM